MIYKKGGDNPADFLSPHPEPKLPKCNMAEQYMDFVTVNAAEAAIPLTVTKEHTSRESSLVAVQKSLVTGLVTKDLQRPKLCYANTPAWFPNIDKAAKEEIDTCLPCQVNGPTNPPEPLLAPEMPDGPWHFWC
ncbi:Hypothetical predicted protein [Paramuricea clavata]|uniref:Uncharacterized protein n=1 Tax=Paramuricea clavata TaxID=317549 RepID=A0A6S7H431_PARCT|nr:Hypothetical predicted protein [Paramuricea clavata]